MDRATGYSFLLKGLVTLSYANQKKITEPEGVYFITFTCLHWQPLIQIVDGYDLVYKWFDYLKSKGHYI